MRIRGSNNGGAMFDAMADAPYRWLWSTTLASNSGRYAVLLVASWLAFQLTRSPLGPGLVSFLAFCPALFVGPIAGVLSDRIDRSRLIRAGSALGGATCVAAAALGAARGFDLVLALALAASAGVGMAFEQPARVSLVPLIVKPRRLLNAFSLMRIPMQGSEFVGPALVTGVLARYGAAPALGLCTVLYALAWLQAARIGVPPGAPPRLDHAGFREELRTGIGYVRGERMLGILILFVGIHCALTMAFMGVLPTMATAVLGGDDATYGILMTAVGLGAMAGPLGLAAWAHRAHEGRLLVIMAFLSGITLAGLGVSHGVAAAVAMAAAAGASQSLFMILIYSRTQGMAVDAMRGRVASFAYFFTGGVMGIFNLLLSAAAGAVGPQAALVGSGLIFVLVTCAFLARVPELRWTVPLAVEGAGALAPDRGSPGVE